MGKFSSTGLEPLDALIKFFENIDAVCEAAPSAGKEQVMQTSRGKIKVLNLYAGIGGNRKLWTNVEVTAVEIEPDIAAVYADLYPKDKLIVGDAHQYLLEHFKEFDFIWSSPPCPTHGSFRQNIGVRYRGVKPAYPDMKLYEEIILLLHNSPQGQTWVVENVMPYYDPLIQPTNKIGRHLYWSNFNIRNFNVGHENLRAIQIPELQQLHGVDLSGYKLKNKRQVLRNCVDGETGLYILNEARTDSPFRHEFKQGALL